MSTIIDVLNNKAGTFCTKPILRYRSYQLEYALLLDRSDRFAGALRSLNFNAGDLIVTYLPNIPEFVTAYYGCLKAGCRIIPMNLSFRKHEVKYIFNNPEVRGIIYWDRFEKKIKDILDELSTTPRLICVGENRKIDCPQFENLIDESPAIRAEEYPSEEDEAVILFSSGTTGNPKGAVLTHASILESARTISNVFNYTSADRILGALPLYNFIGHSAIMNAALLSGSEIILHTRFKPEEIVQSIFKTPISVLIGTPEMYRQLIEHTESRNYNFSSLRIAIVSGDRIEEKLVEKFKQVFDLPLFQGFGCVETTSLVSCAELDNESAPNLLGKPFNNVEIKLL
ncbi:long-chain fatty acid--CoA ligase, partial [candidate division KSB1 bacterium]